MIMTTKAPSTALVITALIRATLNGATKADTDRKSRRILLITYLQTLVLSVKRFRGFFGAVGDEAGCKLGNIIADLHPLDNIVLRFPFDVPF
jgi:hypothetical protein